MSEIVSQFNTTVLSTLLWPVLDKPKAYINPKTKTAQGEPKYGAKFILAGDHPELKSLKNAAIAVARAAWPSADLSTIAWPFQSGTKYNADQVAKGKKAHDNLEGKVILSTTSPRQPALSGTENGQFCDYTGVALEKAYSKFYSGAQVLFQVNFFANEVNGNKYLTAYLNMVYSTGQGTRIGGGSKPAAEVFRGYAGHTTEENPTIGDDEISF